MKQVRWNTLKNERLKKVRGVSFEEILDAKLVAILKHPAKEHQKIMLFEHQGYIWVVPLVEDQHGYFLKTLFPSRKYTKVYKEGRR